jgi:hypothetical protein
MTGFGSLSGIEAKDSGSVDAFARWRTSEPVTIFESQLQYDEQPILWETSLTGGASTSFLTDESSLELTCGTADGDSVIRQTYQYYRYQPGKAQHIICTGVFGDAKANVEKRIGYFDGYNGVFFEQTGVDVNVVLRSFTSGMALDTVVSQADWNVDKLDGTGKSGITLDSTKAQIFIIDLQWLGAGRVRFGVVIGGKINYCHYIQNSNLIDSVYMTTANLPVRYEISNVGAVASSTSMKQICSTVTSEGGLEIDKGIDRSVNNGTTGQSISTRASVLSVRPKDLFGGVKNRGNIIPLDISIFTQTESVFYEIIYRGAVTGASWSGVDSNSITEVSTTSNTVTGGIVVASGYALAGGPPGQSTGFAAGDISFRYSLGSDILGDAQDELSVVCTSLSATATVYASISFKERF